MMKTSLCVIAVCVLVGFCAAQGKPPDPEANFSPEFKDAAEEAYDAVERMPDDAVTPPTPAEEQDSATRVLEGKRALARARRKAVSPEEKSVYELLETTASIKKLSYRKTAERLPERVQYLTAAIQCIVESRAIFAPEKLNAERTEQAKKKTCVDGYHHILEEAQPKK